MTKYTASQFLTLPEQARLSEQPLRDAGPEDYCFVEGEPLLPYKDDMEELVRILWNRKYPGRTRMIWKSWSESCGTGNIRAMCSWTLIRRSAAWSLRAQRTSRDILTRK